MPEQIDPVEIIAAHFGDITEPGHSYPGELPPLLLRWYCYLVDSGHSILVIPATIPETARLRGADLVPYLVPAPVRSVLEARPTIDEDGILHAKIPYDRELGLITDPEHTEIDPPTGTATPGDAEPIKGFSWINETPAPRPFIMLATHNPAEAPKMRQLADMLEVTAGPPERLATVYGALTANWLTLMLTGTGEPLSEQPVSNDWAHLARTKRRAGLVIGTTAIPRDLASTQELTEFLALTEPPMDWIPVNVH